MIDETSGMKHVAARRLIELLGTIHPDSRVYASSLGDLVVTDAQRQIILLRLNFATEGLERIQPPNA